MTAHILAIDQGTTSSRAIVFNHDFEIEGVAQQEFRQYFPQSGWVEHDPEDIWDSTLTTCRQALKRPGSLHRTDRRHRHHQPAGNHAYLGPADRKTHPQGDRLAGPAHRRHLHTAGGGRPRPDDHRQDRSACSTPISPPPRSAGCSTMSKEHGKLAEAGRLAFGTVDTFLLWRLTGGRVHATDATNACRTMLYNIHENCWDEDHARSARHSRFAPSRGPRFLGRFRHNRPELFGAPIPVRGIAGDQQAALVGQACFAPGMIKSTYGTGCFIVLNTGERAGGLEKPSAHHHRLPSGRQKHLCPGRFHLRGRRRRPVDARCHGADRGSQRDRQAGPRGGYQPGRLPGAGLYRSGRSPLGSRCPGRNLRHYPGHRPGRIVPRGPGVGLLPDP